MSRSRPGSVETNPEPRQTTATEMAVAGMFQRSEAPRYILIHSKLAPNSQEVKTNKFNKPTSKQTTQRCGDLWSHLSLFISVPLSQSCMVHTRVGVYAPGLFRHLQTSVQAVQSWERKGAKVWTECADGREKSG